MSEGHRSLNVSQNNDETVIGSFSSQESLDPEQTSEQTRLAVLIARNNLIAGIIINTLLFIVMFASVICEEWFYLEVRFWQQY